MQSIDRNRLILLFACTLAFLSRADPASATLVQLIDPQTQVDAGWQAELPDYIADLRVDAVSMIDDLVVVEISKDYFFAHDGQGNFDPIDIVFTQTAGDEQSVSQIIIADESITNLTGSDWHDYHWAILDANAAPNGGDAWFNIADSSGFEISPFTIREWSGFLPAPPNSATELSASGGIVPYIDTYYPGVGTGELVIDVDLSGEDPVSFIFRQYPTIPEPASLLIAVGVLPYFLLRRIWAGPRRDRAGNNSG